MWPRKKACQHIRDRVREVVRSIPQKRTIGEVIRKLHPILNGWCTYFRVGNSNRVFHRDRLGRAERAAVMAPTQTPMQLAVCPEALELSVPV